MAPEKPPRQGAAGSQLGPGCPAGSCGRASPSLQRRAHAADLPHEPSGAQAAPPSSSVPSMNKAVTLGPWWWLSLHRAHSHRPAPNPAACAPSPGLALPRRAAASLSCFLPLLPGRLVTALVPSPATDPALRGGSPPRDSAQQRCPSPFLGPAAPLDSMALRKEQQPGLPATAVPGSGRGSAATHLVFGVWLCFVSVRGLHLHLAVHRADGGGLGTRQGHGQPWCSSAPAAPQPPTLQNAPEPGPDPGPDPAPAAPRLVGGCREPVAGREVPPRLRSSPRLQEPLTAVAQL